MSSRMPPVPPASRSKHDSKRNPEVLNDDKLAKHEHHPNSPKKAISPISSRTPRMRVTSAVGVSPNHVSISRRHSGSIYDACRNDGDVPDNHA